MRLVTPADASSSFAPGLKRRSGPTGPEPDSVAVSDGSGGVQLGCMGRWGCSMPTTCPIPAILHSRFHSTGLITLEAKCAGARSAGNPHAACEVAGAGNGATELAKRARRGKPRIQPSKSPDGPPRQFPTLHLERTRFRTLERPRAPSAESQTAVGQQPG